MKMLKDKSGMIDHCTLLFALKELENIKIEKQRKLLKKKDSIINELIEGFFKIFTKNTKEK